MYAKIKNGIIVEYPIYNIRALFKNISLPADLSKDENLPNGYVNVLTSTLPDYDNNTQRISEILPIKKDGKWYKEYEVISLTEEEVQNNKRNLVPTSITPRQARLLLLDMKKLDDIEAYLEGDRRSKIEWEFANEILRDSYLITNVGTALGLTPEQIDDMFISANKL